MNRPCVARLASALALVVAPCALALPARARQGQAQAEIEAEIAFARGLAARWTFLDLAEEVIAGIEARGVSPAMAERLALARCEILAAAAEGASEPAARRELYERAMASTIDFLATEPESDAATRAETALVVVSRSFARALALDAEEAPEESALELRRRRSEVLQAASRRARSLVEAIQRTPREEQTEAERNALGERMLDRGEILAELGEHYGVDDGALFYEQGAAALEAVVFEFGDGTVFALRAYAALGRLRASQERWSEAVDFFQAIVEQAIPLDETAWAEIEKELEPDAKDLRWRFVELAAEGLLEALASSGRTEEACHYALHVDRVRRREGFACSAQGYVALLAAARTLLDAGGFVGGDPDRGEARWFATTAAMQEAFPRGPHASTVDFALRVAKEVGRDNEGTALEVRAQRLVAEVIERPGVAVSPETLLDAADGAYHDRDYASALRGYRRALRALDGADDATRRRYGARILWQIGNALRLAERPLESAMAFREGCTTYAPDAEHDAKNAQAYHEMIRRVRQAAGGEEPALEALVAEARELVMTLGAASKDQVVWASAEELREAERYAEAIDQYRRIEPGSEQHERALVAIAQCTLAMGGRAEAERMLDEYVEQYLEDPATAPGTPVGVARREEARALAEYLRGAIAAERAREQPTPAAHGRVIELLAGYADEHREQPAMAARALHHVLVAHLARGETAEADAIVERLAQEHPSSRVTAQASLDYYAHLDARRAAASDAAERRALLASMVAQLARANTLAPEPVFANLRVEASHWLELGEWARAETALQRIVTAFGGDAERADDLRRHVLPDLGRALLAERRVAEAKAILDPLVLDPTDRPTRATVRDHARAVTGWLDGPAGKIEVVVGAGGTPEELAAVVDRLAAAVASLDDEYTCEWFEAELELLYASYVQGQADSRALERCKDLLGRLETLLGEPDWTLVESACASEDTPPAVREALGGGVLRQRYLWLRSKLR